MDTDSDRPAESLFRPSKRRKFIRRRPNDPADSPTIEDGVSTSHENEDETSKAPSPSDENTLAQSTAISRKRRPHPSRKGGIGFSATSSSNKDVNRSTSLVSAEDLEAQKIQAMSDRFTTYTGQSEDVDKHMMAYIDSEMAKRHDFSPLPESREARQQPEDHETGEPSIPGAQREPASLGKLHEIDLGQETKMQNIARTQAATRRLAGDEESPIGGSETQPDRSGPDKPWRNRAHRTSAAIERDRLVEEVLRESKLDVYDEPEEEILAGDQAADDRIAEQFRRDFLDAIQSRRRVRATRNTKTEKPEAPKGPKLGGSRSARAAMREMQGKTGQK